MKAPLQTTNTEQVPPKQLELKIILLYNQKVRMPFPMFLLENPNASIHFCKVNEDRKIMMFGS